MQYSAPMDPHSVTFFIHASYACAALLLLGLTCISAFRLVASRKRLAAMKDLASR